jgi:hypothetical protein
MIKWDEKDFEDWLCSGDPWRIFSMLSTKQSFGDSVWAARQVNIDVGAIDVLMVGECFANIVELKARPATGEDVCQVLEYTGWIAHKVSMMDPVEDMTLDDIRTYVRPVLVATDFSPRIRSACEWSGVRVVNVSMQWRMEEAFLCSRLWNIKSPPSFNADEVLENAAAGMFANHNYYLNLAREHTDVEAQEPGRGVLEQPEDAEIPVALQDAVSGADHEDS